MNGFLTGILNGFLLSIPLTGTVWVLLRLFRGSLNAATRYVVWWVALSAVMILPLWLAPSRPFITGPIPVASGYAVVNRPAPMEIHAESAPLPAHVSKPLTFPLATFDPGPWAARLVFLWAVLASLALLRLGVSYIALQSWKRSAARPAEGLVNRFDQLRVRCGLRRRVRLAILRSDTSPMVAGPFDPCVLIPETLVTSLEPEQLDQVFLHEFAHLARFDDLTLIVQRIVESVFRLHPVVRWITRQLELEREIACDDFVIRETRASLSYASCLARVAEVTSGLGSSRMAAAIANETSHLEKRIEMLLDNARNRGTGFLAWRFLPVVTVVAILAIATARTPRLFAFQAAPIAKPAQPTPRALVSQVAPNVAPRAAAPATEHPSSPVPAVEPQPVNVSVSVTDPLHRFVTGLDRAAFRIFEDGVEQNVMGFSGDDKRVSFCLVWDTAEFPPSAALVEARRQLAALLNTYTPQYPSVRDLQKKIEVQERREGSETAASAAVEAMMRTVPDGITLVLQPAMGGLLNAATQLTGIPGDRAIILVTPAGSAQAGLAQAILQAGLPVFVVEVGPGAGSSELASAAQETGGHLMIAESVLQAATVATKATIEFHNRYVLTYAPPTRASDGKFHNVSVQVTPPRGLPELTVAHSAGYYSPSR